MIGIVDFGLGNLRSLHKAIEHLGAPCELTGDPQRLAAAERLILPGDGHFGDTMRELRERGLATMLTDYAASGRPLLGICIGMQIMMQSSEEAPGVEGLGLFAGTVKRFQSQTLKIPHMGWNTVRQAAASPLFMGINDEDYFYFIHSYHVAPAQREAAIGETEYACRFASIIARDNVFATQFHPEKSARSGLRLLENFVRLEV
jgi:glutamine amidotransferase